MKFNTKFNLQRDKIVGKHFNKPSLTDTSFAYETDINNIVRDCGICPAVNPTPPTFGGEFKPNMYNDALNIVAAARTEFEKLPSNIRREFDNDISKFMDMFDNIDDAKAKKGVKLGIFEPSILEKFVSAETAASQTTSKPETGSDVSPAISD